MTKAEIMKLAEFKAHMCDDEPYDFNRGARYAQQMLIPLIEALAESNKMLVEALQQREEEWCDHPDIKLNENNMYRDWCASCSRWIYRGQTSSPASKALADHAERMEKLK